MQNKDLQDNNTKYDFSNKESQRLFKEFTVLLADITKYVDEKEKTLLTFNLKNENSREELKKTREDMKISQRELMTVRKELLETKEELMKIRDEYVVLSNKLSDVTGGRYMVKALLKKLKNKLVKIFK